MSRLCKVICQIIEGWFNYFFPKKESFVEKVAFRRMAICKTCEHISTNHSTIRPDVHCTICSCTLAAKTRSLHSACPINKWSVEKK
jgi:ribosomal protein S27E